MGRTPRARRLLPRGRPHTNLCTRSDLYRELAGRSPPGWSRSRRGPERRPRRPRRHRSVRAVGPGDASTRTGARRPGPARARRRLRRRRLRRFGACSTWGKYAQTGRADARRYPARSALIGSRPPRPFAASPLRVSQEGFEPTTKRLRVSCSTAELLAPPRWYRRASSTINQLVHQSFNLVRAKRGHSSAR